MKEAIEDNKFTYRDSVEIAKSASPGFHPGKFASICDFYKITSEEGAKEFQCNIGDWIYTIEFPDGSDIQIAETYLVKYEDDK